MDPTLGPLLYRIKRDWQTVMPAIKRGLLSLLFACLPILFFTTELFEAVEPRLLHQWFMLRGARETPQSVSIVRLDKAAYDLVKLSTGEMFPRDRIAEGMDKITAAGAKAIVIDAILQREGDDPEADSKLAVSLATSPSVIGRHVEIIIDTDPQGRRHKKKMSVRPIQLFAESAKAVIPLEVRQVSGIAREITLSNQHEVLASVRVPLLGPLRKFFSAQLVEPSGFDFINFYGGPSSITSLSLADVIGPHATIDRAYFQDRVVLLGVISDAGAGIEAGKDTFLTSVSNSPMYGVEIHATIAANLLDGSWIRRLPIEIESLLMSLIAFVMSYAVLAASGRVATLVIFGTALVWFGFSFYAFCQLYIFVPGLTLFLFLTPLLLGFRWSVLARNRME